MKNTCTFVIALLIIALHACKHEMPTLPATNNSGGAATGNGTAGSASGAGTTEIYFKEDVLPIFQSNCAFSGCHNATSRQAGFILDTYENIMNRSTGGIEPGKPENSKIFRMITEKDPGKRMPKNSAPLTDAQINAIKKWITEGAKNTTNGSCDTSSFYSLAVKPIIDSNCVKCHNGTGTSAPAALNYTTYQGLRTVALNGRLLGAITHSTGFSAMPKNAAKLSDCKIAQIRKWVEAGALNN